MEILTWVIVAIGVLVGGPIMMFGFRNSDQKPVAFGQIGGALKQDWTRTGNIDFHAVAFESSSPQPLRLRVEEKRVTESAAGQDVVELRWRLATLQEGKELVVCWNARQTGLHYSTNPCSETTALARAALLQQRLPFQRSQGCKIKPAVGCSPKRAISLLLRPPSTNG